MISEIIEKWIKGILIDGITGNLSGLFDNVNAKVGEIASDVGSTPQAWNSGIFNMLRNLSETVVLPIAAAILALVMCHELALNGSAFGDGIDWMMRRSCSVLATSVLRFLPSGAVIFKPLQFVMVSFPSSLRRFFRTRQ